VRRLIEALKRWFDQIRGRTETPQDARGEFDRFFGS
jgi:hypothetical protein